MAYKLLLGVNGLWCKEKLTGRGGVFYGNELNRIELSETFLSQDKVNLNSQENALIGADPATAASGLS